MKRWLLILILLLISWTWSFLVVWNGNSWDKLLQKNSYETVPEAKTMPLILKYDKAVENNICSTDKQNFDKGIVSLTFDDGWREIYDNAIPILDRAGIKSTQYITIFGPSPDKSKFFTREQILAMDKNGHEIASHAIHHNRFTEIEPEILRELTESRIMLLDMGVSSVTTFAYPFGEYTDNAVSFSRLLYKAVRTSIPGMNDRKTDEYLLYGHSLQNWMIFDPYIKRLVDRAQAENKWLILIFHQIANPVYPYYTSPEDLILLTNYLIKNSIPIMPIRDVVDKCYQ